MRWTSLVAAVIASLVPLAPVGAAEHVSAAAPLVPEHGLLLGAYVDPDATWAGEDAARQDLEDFEADLGRRLDLTHRFYAWTDPFPGALDEDDRAAGRIPLITWEPWGTDLAAIAAGEHDALIRNRARDLAAYRDPVFLRFGHEMNGNWYPWSGAANGGATGGPAAFRAAWRHVHAVFAAEGATNVVWVWCPNGVSVPDETWNDAEAYYPGDDVVDWVGSDGYNWGSAGSWAGSSWTSFTDLHADLHDRFAGRKPLMIAETSSTEHGGDKAGWIAAIVPTLRDRLPGVRALVWFQADKEQDWRHDSSDTAAHAFRQLASDPYVLGTTATDRTVRLAGNDRVATAAAVARYGWTTAPTALVARADDPADALAGAALAGALGAPMLLVHGRGALPEPTAHALVALDVAEVVVLGGAGAVDDAVVERLRALRGVANVRRIAGGDRAATAAAVAASLPDRTPAFVVRGAHADPARAWPDALAVSGLAARLAAHGSAQPILLSGDTLPGPTKDELAGRPRATVVGGEAAVSSTVLARIDAVVGTVERWAGTDRYATSRRVADARPHTPGAPLLLATGRSFPDALAAGALAGRLDATLLLIPGDRLGGPAAEWLTRHAHEVGSVVLVGGTSAISDAVSAEVEALLGV